LRGVASSVVKTLDIYKGVVPFIALQLVGLAIVGFYPPLVNYLPVRTYLTSETAPPPKNPRLQACLEDYLFDYYVEERDRIEGSTAKLAALDLSSLPADIKRDLGRTVKGVTGIYTLIEDIRDAEQAVEEASVDYRPVHAEVRALERDIRRNKKAIEKIKLEARGTDDPDQKAHFEEERAELEGEIEALMAEIPQDWKEINKDYRKITGNLAKAQKQYRKTVDDSYESLVNAIAVLEATDALAAVEQDLTGLLDVIKEDGDHEAAREAIKSVTATVTEVPGTKAVTSELSKAKKALRKKREKPKKAIKAVKKAIKAFDKDLAARQNAGAEVIGTLKSFEVEIRDTIGLRQQDRLSLEQASAISGCLAKHRDISLSF